MLSLEDGADGSAGKLFTASLLLDVAPLFLIPPLSSHNGENIAVSFYKYEIQPNLLRNK